MDRTLPITLLTGYLGAGKTTLLGRILSQPHGKSIAVLTYELPDAGIDQQLQALIGAFKRILASDEPVDHIMIETSARTAPARVIGAFFADDQIRSRTRLDAILTVVDLRHIVDHWHTPEAVEQIMFGDVLVLNKTDLVAEAELFAVRDRIRRMNPLAKLHVTRHCELPLEAVLNLQAFDLSRALALDGQLLARAAS